jgi:hypothetical protein
MLKIYALTKDAATAGGGRSGGSSEPRAGRRRVAVDPQPAPACPPQPVCSDPTLLLAARLLSRCLLDDGLEAALDAAGPPLPSLLTALAGALSEAAAGAPAVASSVQALMGRLEGLEDDPLTVPRSLLAALEGVEQTVEALLAADSNLVRLDAEISAALRRLGRGNDPELADTLAALRQAERQRLGNLPGLPALRRAHGLLERAIRRASLAQAAALLSGHSLMVEAPVRPPGSLLRLAVSNGPDAGADATALQLTLDYGETGRVAASLRLETPRKLTVAITLGGDMPVLKGTDELLRAFEAAGLRASVRLHRQPHRPAALMPSPPGAGGAAALDVWA